MSQNIFTVIDFAASGIRVVTGYVFEGKVYILQALEGDAVTTDEHGYLDKMEAENSLGFLLNSAKQTLQQKDLGMYIVMFPPDGFVSVDGEDSTATTDSLGRISQADYHDCINKIHKTTRTEGKSIIYCAPYGFLMDKDRDSQYFPIGVQSDRLHVLADVHQIDKAAFDHYDGIIRDLHLDVYLRLVSPFGAISFINAVNGAPKSYVGLDLEKDGYYLSTISKGRLIDAKFVPYGLENMVRRAASNLQIPFEKADEAFALFGLRRDSGFDYVNDSGKTLAQMSNAFHEAMNPMLDDIHQYLHTTKVTPGSNFIFYGSGIDVEGLENLLEISIGCNPLVYTAHVIGARNKVYLNCIGAIALTALPFQPSPKDAMRHSGDSLIRSTGFGREQ